MNFTGEVTLHAPQGQVWHALLDPSALQTCLPGCQSLEETGPDVYQATVTLGIAAVKGTYKGQVRIADKEEPTRYALHIEGTGNQGTVRGTGTMTLAPTAEGTSVRWSAEVQIGGPIASVGQRLIGGVTKLVAGDFFKCMDRRLTEGAASGETAASNGAAATREA